MRLPCFGAIAFAPAAIPRGPVASTHVAQGAARA
jgi:hypothetical protein